MARPPKKKQNPAMALRPNDKLLGHAWDDFTVFLMIVWKYLVLPKPTDVQIDIAKFIADDDNGDSIIEAFRGVGKSYVASAFVLWKLWKNPNLKFLIVSASKIRADDFSTFCFMLIDLLPFLNHLKPNGMRTSKIAWDVGGIRPAQSPSVVSKGINSQITGSRADYVIADDIEVTENSATTVQRAKLKHKLTEFDSIKKGNEGTNHKSRILFLGTPQTEESIYNSLIGYQTRIWTARFPKVDDIDRKYKGTLAPFIYEQIIAPNGYQKVGHSTDPKRFTDEELNEREAKIGKSVFALQFMLDTTLADLEKFPLKLADLIIFQPGVEKAPSGIEWGKNKNNLLKDTPSMGFGNDYFYAPTHIDEMWANYEGSVLAIDPSGSGKDETGYAVVKYLHGYLYVTDAGSVKGGYSNETLKQIAIIAKQQQVNSILVEQNFGQGMFTELLKPVVLKIYRCVIEEVRHSKQKELRIIDTLEPVMNRHRLIIAPSVIEQDLKIKEPHYSLFYQMTRIAKEKGSIIHDDKIDALAMAVGHWVKAMAVDEHKQNENYKDRMLEESLQRVYKRKQKEQHDQFSKQRIDLGQRKDRYNSLDNY